VSDEATENCSSSVAYHNSSCYSDNSTAVLLVSFLFAMLKASENNEDERMILSETLADAANQLPEVVLMLWVFGYAATPL
jgi:hypothetical protein